MNKEEQLFNDICPYPDSMFHEKMEHLVKEPGFEHAVKWVLPQIDFQEFCKELLQVQDKETFQRKIMWPFLEMLAAKTTSGVTMDGVENIDCSKAYTFITNHRDIVLDTSFLNLCFLRAGLPTTEVAIGSNLLIYEWISDLVRLNKSFIVKRNLPRAKALEAASELSAYIHYAVSDRRQSVWIAEREGRSKDSSDLAQDSLIKMLGLAGEHDFHDNLMEINLMPVSISYEYDPNDYLKAREFLMKRRDPNFKKSQRDDLFSMETGLLQFKGHVHFQLTPRINPRLDQLGEFPDNNTSARYVGALIDQAIHRSYEIFPINYVAFDMLHHCNRFCGKYTPEQRVEVERYFDSQLNKVDIEDVTAEERDFMMEMMLVMYSNPLKNKLKTILGGME